MFQAIHFAIKMTFYDLFFWEGTRLQGNVIQAIDVRGLTAYLRSQSEQSHRLQNCSLVL